MIFYKLKKNFFLFFFLLSFNLYAYNPSYELLKMYEQKINQNCQKDDSDCALKIILENTSLEDIYKANDSFYESHKEEISRKFKDSYYAKPDANSLKQIIPASELRKKIRDYYNRTKNYDKCLTQKRFLSKKYDPWKGNSKYLRFLKTSGYSKKFLKYYSIDPYVVSCLTMRESDMLPSSLNYTYCKQKNSSSALGLSMITETTLKYLYNIKGFRSKISRYKDFKKSTFIFDRLTQDPELQIEMGMAILWFVKLQHKNSRKHLKEMIGQYQYPLKKQTYKIYASILRSYYGHTCSHKTLNYTNKILQCAQCLKKITRKNLKDSKIYGAVGRCLGQVYDSKQEQNQIQNQCKK